jgi:predicted ATPase
MERALIALDAAQVLDERRRMQLQAALGLSQMYAIARIESGAAAWRSVLKIAEDLGDIDYQLRALWALWADRQNHGKFREALALAKKFCGRATHAPNATDCLIGERMVGVSLHFLGDQGEARTRVERVLARYAASTRRSDAVRFQFDQRVTGRITLARVLWVQGFADRALKENQSNIDEALSRGHVLSLSNALAQAACPVALLAGDLAAARRFTVMLRRCTAEHALSVWRAYADCFDGELLLRSGDHAAGLQLLQPAVQELRRAGFTIHLSSFLGTLAKGLSGAGQIAEALQIVDEALASCERTGERWYLAELLRLRGEILAKGGALNGVAVAEALFHEALDVARSQGALSWELRAATSLATFWHRQGRAREGCALLSSVTARFSEGFGTADFHGAAGLLQDLVHAAEA